MSSSPRPSSTNGSAPKTNAFEVIVSVSDTATFLTFTPASPYTPIFVLAIGIEVY